MTPSLDPRTLETPSYELRIGVTGHRELPPEKLPAIVAQVDATLVRIATTLGEAAAEPYGPYSARPTALRRASDGIAWLLRRIWRDLPQKPRHVPPERRTAVRRVVVSSLAKGADRLVARAVLDGLPADPVPPRLEVVLPLDVDDYRADFTLGADRDEFESLYARRDRETIVVAPARSPARVGVGANADAEADAEAEAARAAARSEAYYRAGCRVVDACEILLVLWNGKPSRGRGGTADALRYAVDAGRVVLWINTERPDETPRRLVCDPAADSRRGSLDDYQTLPFPATAKELSPGFHRLAAYNRDPLDADAKSGPATGSPATGAPAGSAPSSFPPSVWEAAADDGPTAAAVGLVDRTLGACYRRANRLAERYQRLYFRSAMLVYGLSVLAVAVVAGQTLFFPHHVQLIWLEVFAMLAAGALVLVDRHERWKEKWQNDRQLAEWLRRQLFLCLLHREADQVRRRVVEPRAYAGSAAWFESAYRPLLEAVRRQMPDSPALEPLRRILVDGWVAPQAHWHHGKAHWREHQARRTIGFGWAAAVATLVMALLHAFGVGHGDAHGADHGPAWIGAGITFLAIVLPAVAAALHAGAVLRDHERLAARSIQMVPVLRALVDRLESARDPAELARFAVEADHVMAQENDDWWIAVSGTPPVMPG